MTTKNFKIFVILTLFFSLKSISQVIGGVNPNGTNSQLTFTPRDKVDETKEFKKIAYKMYWNDTIYKATKVDDIIEPVFLRYNIYKDEMEFKNNGKLLFLKKEKDRVITFQYTKERFEVYNYDGKLTYFQVHNDEKAKLLSRKFIEYTEAKAAENSYQKSRPADFRKKEDIFYLKSGNDITELSSKKSKFFDAFNDKSNEIKSYVKKNKLDIDEETDLKKIVLFYNSII